MRVIITGTPGTGKTVVAKLLSKKLGLKYVDGKEFISECSEGYDKRLEAFIVNEKRFAKKLVSDDNTVIDSHMSHFASPKKVRLCVVLRCGVKELMRRLELRKYNSEKVRENVEAEIMNVCGSEAFELGHKIIEINTSKRTPKEVVDIIISEIA